MRGKCWFVWMMVAVWVTPAWATRELSPAFLGMYRKTMEIEREVMKYADRYEVDPHLARAILMQESGGNNNLTSSAGARGYFQVMPATFRLMGVRSNIEAGIKYLALMKQRFGREDHAVAAYNAGPGRVGGSRPLPLETLQYVIGVGQYKSVLRVHTANIKRHMRSIQLTRARKGDSWETLAQRTGFPAPLLRLYNPFLALRPLRPGALVAYPRALPSTFVEFDGERWYYTSRIGDSHVHLAFAFGLEPDALRRDNDLWRLQQLAPGLRLHLRLPPDSPWVTSWRAIQQAVRKRQQIHRVRRGETLTAIARRYRTSVQALMEANNLREPHIQAGASLRVPAG